METLMEKTSKEDQKIANSALSKIRTPNGKKSVGENSFAKIKVEYRGHSLKIPKKALALLYEILNNMAEGKSITLIPSDSYISTQQAADMLNVSRPHLVKLLEKGEIPFTKAGTHRRIELKDLVDYDEKQKKTRNENLNFLAKQAQDLELGY